MKLKESWLMWHLKACRLGGEEKSFVGYELKSIDVLDMKDRTHRVILGFSKWTVERGQLYGRCVCVTGGAREGIIGASSAEHYL